MRLRGSRDRAIRDRRCDDGGEVKARRGWKQRCRGQVNQVMAVSVCCRERRELETHQRQRKSKAAAARVPVCMDRVGLGTREDWRCSQRGLILAQEHVREMAWT
jgi:hypothetical protein